MDARIRNVTYEQETIRQSGGLRVLDDCGVPNVVPYSAREFIGFCRSTSYGSAYARTLTDQEAYWRDLESRFREAWGEDKIPVDFHLWFILAQRMNDS